MASVVFGGVSGSAVANASALGSVLIPWQKRQGYPAGLCAANNATSAIIDIMIPPSIPLILYSLVSGVSIADLFTAGILPGILLAGGLILTCSLIARRRGIHSEDPAVGRIELLRLAVVSSPALLMPILILLGLRFGIATPTEISVLAVVYALALSAFFYRDLTWKRFYHSLIESGIATGVVMLVIMGSAIVGWILTFDEVPTRFAEWVTATISNPLLVILAMNILLLHRRHAARSSSSDPAPRADLRPPGGVNWTGPGATRDHHGAESGYRPLHAADRNHALHLLIDRTSVAGRHHS